MFKQQACVLIVDDDDINISTIKVLIEAAGYCTLAARNGRQALEVVANNIVDLILLDVMMPGMDGFETCEHLKKNEAYADIPVIFLTALTDTESLVLGFEAGGVDYITKPFQRAELLAKTKNHIELSALHKLQAALIRDIQEQNINLEAKNIHLENMTDMLPEVLLKQLINVEDVCLELSADLDDAHQETLNKALGYIEQMKVAMEALYMLTVNASP